MLPVPYDKQMEIANLFLIGMNEEQISKQTWIALSDVKFILADEKIQKYIQSAMNNEELQMHYKRLKRASSLLDSILNKIEDFVNDESMPVSKRKEQHVKLIKEFLYDKLPNVISKTVQTAIQVNIWTNNQQQVKAPSSIDEKVNKLKPDQIVEFWDIVDNLLDNPNCIFEVHQLLQNKCNQWVLIQSNETS